METSFFRTEALSAGYKEQVILKNVAFGLQRGRVVSLIGPNGAGKTTLLKTLMRQLRPQAGVIKLDGKDLGQLRAKELAQRLSIVLTDPLRTEYVTCEEIVASGRHPYTKRLGILSQSDQQVVDEMLEITGLSELRTADFMKMSDGQKQRVLLARALSQEPEVIIMDEPTSYLDIRYKLEFFSCLQEMVKKKNLLVILSLHELEFAQKLSDWVICLKEHGICRQGTPEQIFTGGFIQELFEIETGSFDDRTGSAELKRQESIPKVFVFAGNGEATPLYRRLQREQTAFSTGILWKNDIDYPVARALAGQVLAVDMFSGLSPELLEKAKEQIDRTDRVLCPAALEGLYENEPSLRSLLSYARAAGKLCTES